MTPLCFTDTETTSLGWDRRVWEVAMIRRDDQGTRERRFFIKSVDLADADAVSLRIGRFYDRHPQYSPPGELPVPGRAMLERYDAAREVERWTRGAVVVAANPGFDLETLGRMLRSVHLLPAWHYTPVCVKAMAYGWLAARGLLGDLTAASGSTALAEACGVVPPSDEDRHTALGDARWVQRWYDRMVGDPA